MQFLLSDLSRLTHFLEAAMLNNGHRLIASPSYRLRREDLSVIIIEKGGTVFLLHDKGHKTEHYSISEFRELLYKFYPQNENIRPFVKYKSEYADFVIDMHKMYQVFERIQKIAHWDNLRENIRTNGAPLAKSEDESFIDIINKNIKRLCDIEGGYIYAVEWINRKGDPDYKLPVPLSHKKKEDLRPLNFDGLNRIIHRIQTKQSTKNKSFRKGL